MRSGILAIGLALILATGSMGQDNVAGAPAADSVKPKGPSGPAHVTLQPYLAIMSGYTKYEMDVSGYERDTFLRLQSELEFPLDLSVAGAGVTVELPNSRWSIEGGGFFSLNNPTGKMKDWDWITKDAIPYLQNLQFGYTESRVEASLFQVQVGLSYAAYRSGRIDLRGDAGFRYQHIEQTAMGYAGTYVRYWEGPSLPVDTVASAQRAVEYRVNYSTCFAGMKATVGPVGGFHFILCGAGCFFWASDFDDHLLRGKTGKADGTGTGGNGSFELVYWLGPEQARTRLFVSLMGESLYLSATARQTQHWYRDEPIIGGIVPAGTTVPGIHHKITTQQTRIGGSVGIRF